MTSSLRYLFCADPAAARPDEPFGPEWDAVQALGATACLVDHDELSRGDLAAALRRVKPAEPPVLAVYRGWMVDPATYAHFHEALLGRGLRLVTDPAQYRRAHHLPEWHDLLRGRTPRSVWVPAAGLWPLRTGGSGAEASEAGERRGGRPGSSLGPEPPDDTAAEGRAPGLWPLRTGGSGAEASEAGERRGGRPGSSLGPEPPDSTEGLELERLMSALAAFGDRPVLVKDYVKSEKHDWEGACFIPSAASREHVDRVVRGFLGWRGAALEGGLVFREFVELERIGQHPASGLPLAREFRVFLWEHEVLAWAPYWETGDYEGEPPPLEWVQETVREVRSRFFTADVARTRGGEWLIVELGDGQVSGLPAGVDPLEFHRELIARAAEGAAGEPGRAAGATRT